MPANSPPAARVSSWSSRPKSSGGAWAPSAASAAGARGCVGGESTKVERPGCGTIGDLGIWDDAFIEPLKRVVKFIKQQNSAAGIQLGHSGRKARARGPWEGDGPLPRTSEG